MRVLTVWAYRRVSALEALVARHLPITLELQPVSRPHTSLSLLVSAKRKNTHTGDTRRTTCDWARVFPSARPLVGPLHPWSTWRAAVRA